MQRSITASIKNKEVKDIKRLQGKDLTSKKSEIGLG